MVYLKNYFAYTVLCLYMDSLLMTCRAFIIQNISSTTSLPVFHCSPIDRLLSLNEKSQRNCDGFQEYKDREDLLKIKGVPMRIMYNRVPKTGSTTLRTIMREHAKYREYKMYSVTRHISFLIPNNLQEDIAYKLFKPDRPTLYERHTYFIDFEKFNKPQPVYINLIRDPISRAVSNYYFARARCASRSICFLDTKFLNETLDECVENRLVSECLTKEHGIGAFLEFFCGQEELCNKNKTYASEMAKKNFMAHYTVVGILEELYNFLFVLESLFPKFFGNIRHTYMSFGTPRELNTYSNRDDYKAPSEKTKAKLRSGLVAEYEFYDLVKQRFHAQYQQILRQQINEMRSAKMN